MNLRAPAPLAVHHEIKDFDSGADSLDHWLKHRALKNQSGGASRTFVACNENRVLAYYALATSAVAVNAVSGRFRRNMPDPIPVVVLGRLAIDRTLQGRGIGRFVVRDVAMRVHHAAQLIGIRGLLVHAISDDARAFYEKMGFEPSALDPMTLVITMADIQALL